MRTDFKLKKLVAAGICLALCMVLPFLTWQNQQLGNMFSLMHIPVLLCGFVCGVPYGILIGAIAPLLRFVLFGMPPLFPIGTAMAFELAVYGLLSGLLYRRLPKKVPYIYAALAAAMLSGRAVWGMARFALSSLTKQAFTFEMFLTGAFVTAVPGILCHLILVPVIVLALKRANLLFTDEYGDSHERQ